jgi:tRNA (cmo5U34)-methyltransferase
MIPRFDDLYQAVISQIPFPEAAEFQILDPGAGTGLLSLFVSQRFPSAKITLVDLSEGMAKKARERFARSKSFDRRRAREAA